MKIERFPNNPIIRPDMMPADIGNNINGPSLIKVPDWLPNPLGKYYLYFGHHRGTFIRLAYADHLEGPWRVRKAGVLDLKDAYCDKHVASPDVLIDEETRELRMYYHGPVLAEGGQVSKLSTSRDGLDFTAFPESLGTSYFRVFRWGGYYYAIGMPGIFYRSRDGRTQFEQGPTLFPSNTRHPALKLDGDVLTMFYTMVGDAPETILMTRINLDADWNEWKPSDPVTVLAPEMDYEGTDAPIEPSARGPINERVRQLRDPAIYREDNETYLLYSVAGEQGIAIAKVTDNPD